MFQHTVLELCFLSIFKSVKTRCNVWVKSASHLRAKTLKKPPAMRNSFVPFLALILLAVNPAVGQAPAERALLWEVSGGDLNSPSHLFGTFHILCASDFSVDGVLQEKLAEAEQVYLEIDFSDPQLQGQLLQHAFMKNDTTLSQFFTKEEFARVAAAFQQATGQPLALLQRLKPFLFVSMVLPAMLDCELTGVEVALMEAIDTDQVQIKGLETVAQQMAVFDRIPYGAQAKQFEELLFKQDSVKQAMGQLLALYQAEDIAAMQALTEGDPSLRAYSDVLLGERNENWIPIMVDAMREKPTFFAVGAAHLAGPTGVISLLRQAGYTVEPVVR